MNPELERHGTILMTGASFAHARSTMPRSTRLQFMVGPDYTEMVGILLQYIAKTKPGAKVALVYSDTEFGRDPVEAARNSIKELGLNLVTEIVTRRAASTSRPKIVKLRRADPDYTIFHGYVSAPIPEFITQAKSLGLKSQFMGTFWTMDNSTVMKMGPAADGFMGVMPYRYYYDTEGKSPMLEKIRKMRPEYQTHRLHAGLPGGDAAHRSGAKRTLEAGNELTGANMKIALNSIQQLRHRRDHRRAASRSRATRSRSAASTRPMQAAEDGAGVRLDRRHRARRATDHDRARPPRRREAGDCLEVNNIEVVYNKAVQVLRGLSLAVPRGQIVALLGSNGAGKRTTLKAISNLLELQDGEMTGGEVRFDGSGDPRHGARTPWCAPALFHVMEGRRVFEDLTRRGEPGRRDLRADRPAGARAGLRPRLRLFPAPARAAPRPGGLPFGRRTADAGHRPGAGRRAASLMLLDEPSLGLSPVLVETIFEIIARINAERGVSMLLVEQNASMALAVAHYGYIMETGKVVIDNTAEQPGRRRRRARVLSRPRPGGRAEELPRAQALQAPQALAVVSLTVSAAGPASPPS